LLACYNKLYTLHTKVDNWTQVLDLVNSIAHEISQTIVIKIVVSDKRAKTSLKTALACIGEYMQLLGIMTTRTSKGEQATLNCSIKKYSIRSRSQLNF
jgi:hypothetical protein